MIKGKKIFLVCLPVEREMLMVSACCSNYNTLLRQRKFGTAQTVFFSKVFFKKRGRIIKKEEKANDGQAKS